MFDQETVELFMRQAIKQAEKAVAEGEVPVGCVLVRKLLETGGYDIVKRSHNLTNKTKNASSHAEMVCLKQLERQGHQQQCHELTLFVTVEPCIMCAKALQLSGIRHVYFGQYNERFGGCGSVMKLNTYPAEGGYLQHESNELLKKFYQKGNETIPEEKRNRKRVHRQQVKQ